MTVTFGRESFPTPACTGVVTLNLGSTASSAASPTVVLFIGGVPASSTIIPVPVGTAGRGVVPVVLGRTVGMSVSSMLNITSGDPTASESARPDRCLTRISAQRAALITCKMLEPSDFQTQDSLPTSRRGVRGPPI